jgi:hypothetical protein
MQIHLYRHFARSIGSVNRLLECNRSSASSTGSARGALATRVSRGLRMPMPRSQRVVPSLRAAGARSSQLTEPCNPDLAGHVCTSVRTPLFWGDPHSLRNAEKPRISRAFLGGERRGSNPRPPEPQSGALPAELRPPRASRSVASAQRSLPSSERNVASASASDLLGASSGRRSAARRQAESSDAGSAPSSASS